MNWFGLNRLALWFVRKILFVLVKTNVQPSDFESLNIDPNKPVCYVLKNKSLSNFLVLDQECKQAGLPRPTNGLDLVDLKLNNASFFLVQPRNALNRKPVNTSVPEKLLQMVEYASSPNNEQKDIQLIPVSIFWGRIPDKENSIFKMLFSDSWAVPGFFRKLFIIMAHGRNTIVNFSEPVSIQQAIEGIPDNERAVRKISRILRVHFRRLRETVVGPDLSHKRTIVNALLRQPAVVKAIADDAAEKNVTQRKIAQKAQAYAEEIAADYSHPVIRLYDVVLTWLWNKLYDGVSISHFEKLHKVAKDNVVIYVPCHRSHIDYLLMSYALYRNRLVPPHIAAGVNLNLPILGGILRRGGAFFLRRSFKGNNLYTAVFNEYVNLVFDRGFSVEYFIEGGRSRTGRLLQPRPGMISMTVRSFLRTRRRSFVFVPIYFGYERVLEGRTYVGELQGANKKKESLFDIFATLRKIKGTFGKVHVNFGDPIHLNSFLDEQHPGWSKEIYDEDAPPAWLNSTVEKLGQTIISGINQAAVVNPVSLLSTIILATPRNAMDEKSLIKQLDIYQSMLSGVRYSEASVLTDMTGEEIVAYAERLDILSRQKHPLGDVMMVEDSKAVLLTYFRNNNIHLLAIPSLIACLLINNHRTDSKAIHSICRQVYPFLQAELFIHWNKDELETQVNTYIERFADLGWLTKTDAHLVAPQPSSAAFIELTVLSGIIRPTLERFYIAIDILLKSESGNLERSQLENLCHLIAQRISILHEFNAPEFFDKATFKIFLQSLLKSGLVWEAEGKLAFDDRLNASEIGTSRILTSDIRQTIQQVTHVNIELLEQEEVAVDSK